MTGEYSLAIETLREALRRRPDYAEAVRNISIATERLNNAARR
jgi:hypothetical protein